MSSNAGGDAPPPDPQSKIDQQPKEGESAVTTSTEPLTAHPTEPTAAAVTGGQNKEDEQGQKAADNNTTTPSPPKSPSDEDATSFHSAEEEGDVKQPQQQEEISKERVEPEEQKATKMKDERPPLSIAGEEERMETGAEAKSSRVVVSKPDDFETFSAELINPSSESLSTLKLENIEELKKDEQNEENIEDHKILEEKNHIDVDDENTVVQNIQKLNISKQEHKEDLIANNDKTIEGKRVHEAKITEKKASLPAENEVVQEQLLCKEEDEEEDSPRRKKEENSDEETDEIKEGVHDQGGEYIEEDEEQEGDDGNVKVEEQERLPIVEERELDEDELKESPAYIPKQGRFYMHDDARSIPPEHKPFASEDEEEEELENEGNFEEEDGQPREETTKEMKGKKLTSITDGQLSESKTRADRVSRWRHDMFDEGRQAPKSSHELVQRYGRDIRREGSEEDGMDDHQQQPVVRERQQRGGAPACERRGGGGDESERMPNTPVGQGGRIVVNRSARGGGRDYQQTTQAPRRTGTEYQQQGGAHGRTTSFGNKAQSGQRWGGTSSDTMMPKRRGRLEKSEGESDDGGDGGAGGWNRKKDGWGRDVQTGDRIDNQYANRRQASNNRQQGGYNYNQQIEQNRAPMRQADDFDGNQQQRRPPPPARRGNEFQFDYGDGRYPQQQQYHQRGGGGSGPRGRGGMEGKRPLPPTAENQQHYYGSNQQRQSAGTGRQRASDYFDDDQQQRKHDDEEEIIGGFGRPHRTAAPPLREGRFSVQEQQQQHGGRERDGRFPQNHQENHHQQRGPPSSYGVGGRGSGGGGFGSASQREAPPRRSPNHQQHQHNNDSNRPVGGAQNQQRKEYPHPRQPTEPVFFDTAQQHSRRNAQVQPRERRQLPIVPPQ